MFPPALIVLLMFAADIATLSVATGRVTSSRGPDRWSVPSPAAAGGGLGMFLLGLSAAVYLSGYLSGLTLPQAQTLIFAWLVSGGAQAVLCLTRNRGWFRSRPYPGRWLLAISLLDIAAVTILAWQGWLMAPISSGLIAAAFGLAADLVKIDLTGAGSGAQAPTPAPARHRAGLPAAGAEQGVRS